ncbi:unnamed protein product [Hymenolepis diminuta]|uniref:Aminoacyl-tRNA synthetase class II (D/K/N) domain-containing protein n=1 Tax=Hymenolepis diminuta TaxID=6216 RepID=A0A564Y4T9_HYMDI|nr:unnamed protein product [Hymenolepis diminuta]
MSYEEAIHNYGSDKPDVRFDMKLQDSATGRDDKFAYFVIPAEYAGHLSRSFFQKMLFSVKEKDALELSVLSHDKLKLLNVSKTEVLSRIKSGESVIMAKGFDHAWRKALGTARVLIAKEVDSLGIKIYKPGFFFHWVEDFPLFSKDDNGNLVSEHHPFTAPIEADKELLYSDPEKVHGQHYDLVCNGQEVGGGSIRIHQSDTQRFVLESILREDVSTLKHLLEALSFGAPPHGGIALGLDRLVAILTGAQTVRDVIAFPKTSEGRDLLSDAPDVIPPTDLHRYFIRVLEEDSKS